MFALCPLIVLLVVLLPPPAMAAVNSAILAADNSVSGSFGGLDQHYGEFADGLSPGMQYLDTEQGHLARIEADLTLLKFFGRNYCEICDPAHSFDIGVYLALRGAYAFGTTGYTGHCQVGMSFIPARTTTDNRIVDSAARLGFAFSVFQRSAVIPFVEYGTHEWSRAIQSLPSCSGARETYSDTYLGGGVLLQHTFGDSLVLGVDAMGGTTEVGEIDSASLDAPLGPHQIYRAGLTADLDLWAGWFLTGRVDYTNFGYGQSPMINNVFEPRSHTAQLGYQVGLGYSF